MLNEVDVRARDILRANDKGGFTVPTGGLYPYQWNWDSVFVALGFATFDESRACSEIETLLEAQWDDGMVPHIIFRSEDTDYFPGPGVWQAGAAIPSSGITQPPITASVINDLWDASTNDEIRARLGAMFPKVLAWHRWFHKFRVPDGIDAVVITHPWESGRDNSPEWDAPSAAIDVSGVKPYRRRDLQHVNAEMRPTKLDYDRYMAVVYFGRNAGWDQDTVATKGPFRVTDIGMTMILLRATRDLIELAGKTGHEDVVGELNHYVRQLERGADYHWDEQAGTYCSRDVISGAFSGYVTSASFLYCYAGVGTPRQRETMAAHWNRISEKSRFMLPSHDPDDSHFDALRYWRGPVWMVVNYMLAKGFQECGLHEWAARIRSDSRQLISENGFHEAFCPLTGAGTGGGEFSWTAAMWLAWCRSGTNE